MAAADELERGRAAFEARSWDDAFGRLAAADRVAPLEPDDLVTLATAAYLTGRQECGDLWERAHRELANRGDAERAAGCAFWLAFTLVNRGELARAAAWAGRGLELLDDGQRDCVQLGYLRTVTGIQALMQGEPERALACMLEGRAVAEQFADADLKVLTTLGHGQVLIAIGRTDEGVGLLDGLMVALTLGEVSPSVAGLAYCAAISACQQFFDLQRAQQWTTALTHWCDEQPDLVPYSGQCLVHRAEIMQRAGDWPDAVEAAHAACERFELAGDRISAGAAYYVTAEIARLRGEGDVAEEGYRQASARGRDPQPGLALLRLAQGRPEAAASTIRRVADEIRDPGRRPYVLAAQADICLAVDDVPGARAAADELGGIAAALGAPLLVALADHAAGAVLVAEGDPSGALGRLRSAWTGWKQLDANYEAACTRVLIGLACRALGDEDGAQMDLDAALSTFQNLGAAPDVARVERLTAPDAPAPTGGLTAREVQVLRLVATGRTNRAIAADLVLSEKTVARHVSNIFTKLSVSSRAAATGYAYQHHLV